MRFDTALIIYYTKHDRTTAHAKTENYGSREIIDQIPYTVFAKTKDRSGILDLVFSTVVLEGKYLALKRFSDFSASFFVSTIILIIVIIITYAFITTAFAITRIIVLIITVAVVIVVIFSLF